MFTSRAPTFAFRPGIALSKCAPFAPFRPVAFPFPLWGDPILVILKHDRVLQERGAAKKDWME